MGKKQTYASVMKQLSSKKAKFEEGLAEAERIGSPSGVKDYERRLAKLSAGMDELFQAQEGSKMGYGGKTKMYAEGGTTAFGGWSVKTVPNDGSHPQAFVNDQGEYVLLSHPDGRVAPMTPEMSQQLNGGNPKHLFFKLTQGDYDEYFAGNNWNNTESVNYDDPETQARLAENPNVPVGHELSYPESPEDLGPSGLDMLTNPDFMPAGPNEITTTPAGPMGAREQAQFGGKIFQDDATFNNVNMIPAAEAGAPVGSTPAPGTAAALPGLGAPGRMEPMQTLGVQAQGPQGAGIPAKLRQPSATNVGTGMDAAPGLRSKVEDAGMSALGALQPNGGGMSASTKQGLGMAMGAAAQFLPDISAMRAMNRIEGPVDTPFQRLQLMNTDVQTGRALNQVDLASSRAQEANSRNVSNPAVAAAMARANQRIAAGQKANILGGEAETELNLRNQNLMLANQNMNTNKGIDAGNKQATINFENDKIAAQNRMRQQMGMKLGQVAGDFQNMHSDKLRFDMLSKMYDPALLNRNDIDWNSLFGTKKK